MRAYHRMGVILLKGKLKGKIHEEGIFSSIKMSKALVHALLLGFLPSFNMAKDLKA